MGSYREILFREIEKTTINQDLAVVLFKAPLVDIQAMADYMREHEIIPLDRLQCMSLPIEIGSTFAWLEYRLGQDRYGFLANVIPWEIAKSYSMVARGKSNASLALVITSIFKRKSYTSQQVAISLVGLSHRGSLAWIEASETRAAIVHSLYGQIDALSLFKTIYPVLIGLSWLYEGKSTLVGQNGEFCMNLINLLTME